MFVPANHTESEVIDLIYKIARRISYKFQFGYHEIDDLVQQAILEIIENNILVKYDERRPLANFLYTHIHNRLFNYKRNNFMRPNPPCSRCMLGESLGDDGTCPVYDDKLECEQYAQWSSKNVARRNIMDMLEFGQVNDYGESSMSYEDRISQQVDCEKILNIIEGGLSNYLRADFTRLKYGCGLSKSRTEKIREEALEILAAKGILFGPNLDE